MVYIAKTSPADTETVGGPQPRAEVLGFDPIKERSRVSFPTIDGAPPVQWEDEHKEVVATRVEVQPGGIVSDMSPEGEFGVGLAIDQKTLRVTGVSARTSSARSGMIQVGDELVAVGGLNCRHNSAPLQPAVWAVNHLRGSQGTTVTASFFRIENEEADNRSRRNFTIELMRGSAEFITLKLRCAELEEEVARLDHLNKNVAPPVSTPLLDDNRLLRRRVDTLEAEAAENKLRIQVRDQRIVELEAMLRKAADLADRPYEPPPPPVDDEDDDKPDTAPSRNKASVTDRNRELDLERQLRIAREEAAFANDNFNTAHKARLAAEQELMAALQNIHSPREGQDSAPPPAAKKSGCFGR